MSGIAEELLEPAILVALAAVIVQGIKSVYDIVDASWGRRQARQQQQISYVAALLNLVDAMPINEGAKVDLKVKLVKGHLPSGVPSELLTVSVFKHGKEEGQE